MLFRRADQVRLHHTLQETFQNGRECAKPERKDENEVVGCEHGIVCLFEIFLKRLHFFEALMQDGSKVILLVTKSFTSCPPALAPCA